MKKAASNTKFSFSFYIIIYKLKKTHFKFVYQNTKFLFFNCLNISKLYKNVLLHLIGYQYYVQYTVLKFICTACEICHTGEKLYS